MGAGTVYDALEEILIPQSFVVDRAAVLAEKRRSGLLEAQHPFLKKGEMMSAPGDESCLVWPQELPCRTSWVEKGHALCSLGDRLTLPEAMATPGAGQDTTKPSPCGAEPKADLLPPVRTFSGFWTVAFLLGVYIVLLPQ